MSSSKLLLPLRVPELGPYLGKVVTGTGRSASALPLDDIRLRLATRVIEYGGEARRLATRDERRGTVAAIGAENWHDAWREAATAATALLLQAIDQRLQDEAKAVGMSARRVAAFVPSPEDRADLQARFQSAGLELTLQLEALTIDAEAAASAGGDARDSVDAWQRSITLAARKLESAWIDLEHRADEELGRWETVAQRVADWRRPLWPVIAVGVIAAGAATWLGLVFGGYIDPPQWFATLWTGLFGE